MQVICVPLGWLMRAAYNLTGNYGLAVILFTLMTKVILLPVSLWVHVNGIKMVKLEPAVNRLKVKYFGDPDKIADEQALLYKKAHYNPFATVIPVAIQILLLIGLVQIIYHPDIWLKKYNTAIFVHGCFWHHHEGCKYASSPKTRIEFWNEKFRKNKERDSRVMEELKSSGIKTLIIWECTVKQMMKSQDVAEKTLNEIEIFLLSNELQKEL